VSTQYFASDEDCPPKRSFVPDSVSRQELFPCNPCRGSRHTTNEPRIWPSWPSSNVQHLTESNEVVPVISGDEAVRVVQKRRSGVSSLADVPNPCGKHTLLPMMVLSARIQTMSHPTSQTAPYVIVLTSSVFEQIISAQRTDFGRVRAPSRFHRSNSVSPRVRNGNPNRIWCFHHKAPKTTKLSTRPLPLRAVAKLGPR
jgi:hypothetical protein